MSFSSSLTSCFAVLVLAAIVWVGLVFHSLVLGIEENWVSQLTALHAPITLVPHERYYHSHHYLDDFYSEELGYKSRSFSERIVSEALADPVANARRQLKKLQELLPSFEYSSFENTGGLLTVWAPSSLSHFQGGSKEIAQMALLAPFPDHSSSFQKLLLSPTLMDINYLVQTGAKNLTENERQALFKDYLQVEEVKLKYTPLPISLSLLPENIPFSVQEDSQKKIFCLCDHAEKNFRTIKKIGKDIFLLNEQGDYIAVDYPVVISTQALFQATLSLGAENGLMQEPVFLIKGNIAGVLIKGEVPVRYFSVIKAHCKTHFADIPTISPPWAYKIQQDSANTLSFMPQLQNIQGLLLPKQLQKQGVVIGSLVNFNLPTVTQQGFPAMVVGFYDCGLIPLGPRTAIARQSFVETVRDGAPYSSLDQSHEEGFHVWPKSLKNTQGLAERISSVFQQEGLLPFWQIFTYLQYPFVADIFAQFQSDRLLFLVVFFIIFLIACSNIVSFLVILTQEKTKEIGLFKMFGCNKLHIVLIFALLGCFIGFLGSILGVVLAYATLQNLPSLISFLAHVQGLQEALPLLDQAISLSVSGVLYTIIGIPLFTLLVALIPSWNAARLDPSHIFRSPHVQ